MDDLAGAVLVIGYGNPQRGDDGVGGRILDALRAEPPDPGAPSLSLREVHELVPELAESVSRCLGVVFVDARTGGPAGEVACEAVTPGGGTMSFSHALTPAAVLLYAERLYGRAPRAAALTVVGACFEHRIGLSPEVLDSVPRAARMVRDLARHWARDRPGHPDEE